MNRAEITDLFTELMERHGIAISRVVQFKPTMSTKEVCEYLGRSRPWVIERWELFGGTRVNDRGDFRFRTDKVVQYRVRQEI